MGLDPLTLGIGVAAVGSVLGAGAAVMQGQQAADQAEFQAAVSERQAAENRDAAVAQAEKIRRAARQQQGEATAALAASGVSLGTGTALRISNEIYRTSEEDAYQTILSGRRAYNAGAAQAGLLRSSGQNAAAAGVINAGSSLLSTAGSALRRGWQAPAPVVDRSSYIGSVA